jgi:hypothetical protein
MCSQLTFLGEKKVTISHTCGQCSLLKFSTAAVTFLVTPDPLLTVQIPHTCIAQSWPNSRYYRSIRLQCLRKITTFLIQYRSSARNPKLNGMWRRECGWMSGRLIQIEVGVWTLLVHGIYLHLTWDSQTVKCDMQIKSHML